MIDDIDVLEKAIELRRDIYLTPDAELVFQELCKRFGMRYVYIKRHKLLKFSMTSIYGNRRSLSLFETGMWLLFKMPPTGYLLYNNKKYMN